MRHPLILAAAVAAMAFASGSALAQGNSGAHAGGAASIGAGASAGFHGADMGSAHMSASAGNHFSATTTTTTDSPLRGPDHTGQPGVECGAPGATNTPGQAANAPGSPFNEAGVAGQHYAGEQPQNSRNTASVSQYDSACAHQNH